MQDQKKWAEPLKNPWLWAIPTIATILLIIISRFSFLTFHTLAELITIIIAFNITAFAWSTHDFTKNNFLMFLACGYFWIALLDLIHTLVYKGMDVFIAGSGNLSVQFWLSARYLEALLLFIAPLAASRNLNRYTLLGGFGIIAIALSVLVFSGNFPTGFVEGTGLTDFKIYSEYLIDLILVGALVVLFRYGTGISIEEKVIIGASILLTVMAEMAFTFYVSVYGLSNLAGHIFKLFSYWFIFHAIFLHNLRNPYTALQKSEDLFRRTFENSGIAITIRSARDRSLLMNKAFQKMTGYSDEEMRGIHLRTITHPDEWEENENIRRRVYEENVQNVQVTRRLVKKNGDTIFVINEMSAIRDDKGELEYLVSLYQDITEYKQAEEKLHQAQKMEAVGQLTGGIAHDFNNLLAVCMGNIELAQEESQRGGNVQPALNTVMRAIERGAALTRQLLAFSRKQTLTPQTVNVEKLVAGMSELLRSALGETIEIDLKTARDPAPWPCLVDPHQLESAILNLAINARDAMPDGGKITIQAANLSLDSATAAQQDAAPGDYVKVTVSDTGTGMSKSVMEHVFDPFFTTKEVGRGSGLGLSMVYGFIKQSNGHVTIDSEEGVGSTITLYLPRAIAAEETAPSLSSIETPVGKGETILVVEDNPDVRTLAVTTLNSLGYKTLEAENGVAAIKLLEMTPNIDLLFTDMVLPGNISGTEIAAEAWKRYPSLAVLLTSGYADPNKENSARPAETSELLQKPYRRSDLAQAVRRALDRARD